MRLLKNRASTGWLQSNKSKDVDINQLSPAYSEENLKLRHNHTEKPRRRKLNAMNLKIYHIPELDITPTKDEFNLPTLPWTTTTETFPTNTTRHSLANFTNHFKSSVAPAESTQPDLNPVASPKGTISQRRRSHSSSRAELSTIQSRKHLSTTTPTTTKSSRASFFKLSSPQSPRSSFFKPNQSPTISSLFRSDLNSHTLNFQTLNFELPNDDPWVPLVPSTSLKRKEDMMATHMFWLLKKIRTSILQGGRITSRLYIPSQLWQQPKVTIDRMSMKAIHLQWLTSHFNTMSNIDVTDLTQVRLHLNDLDVIVHNIQVNIAKDQSTRSTPSFMKHFRPKDKLELLPSSRPARLPSSPLPPSPTLHTLPYSIEEYSLTVVQFIDSCHALEAWFQHLLWSPTPLPLSISHGLYRVTFFLTRTIIASLLEDITYLLTSYLDGMTNDLTT